MKLERGHTTESLGHAKCSTGFLVRRRMCSDVHFYLTVGEEGRTVIGMERHRIKKEFLMKIGTQTFNHHIDGEEHTQGLGSCRLKKRRTSPEKTVIESSRREKINGLGHQVRGEGPVVLWHRGRWELSKSKLGAMRKNHSRMRVRGHSARRVDADHLNLSKEGNDQKQR